MGGIRLTVATFLLLAVGCSKQPERQEPSLASANNKQGLGLQEEQGHEKSDEDHIEANQGAAMTAEDYLNRGYEYLEKKQYDKAIKDFTEAIRLDPKFADAYLNRGVAFEKKKAYEQAIKDYTETIRLNPKDSDAYFNRGVAYEKKEEYDKAIKDYTKVIQLDPKDSFAYSNRGNAYKMKLEYKKAMKDYTKAVQLGPNPYAHNALGWMLATCPNDGLRDGKRAIEHATKACELWKWKDAYGLETLAAAHAESGDFKEAVKWQKRATKLGFPDEDKQERAQQRLKRYEGGKPHRDE